MGGGVAWHGSSSLSLRQNVVLNEEKVRKFTRRVR